MKTTDVSWRSRIDGFKFKKTSKTISKFKTRECTLYKILCATVAAILLIIGGVELNPGPQQRSVDNTLSDSPTESEDGPTELENLYEAGFVLVETGSVAYLTSFVVSLLQHASKNYETQLNIDDLPLNSALQNWHHLTSKRRQNIPSGSVTNSNFFETICETVEAEKDKFETDFSPETQNRIIKLTETYFHSKIDLKIVQTTKDFYAAREENPDHCFLYKNMLEKTFSLILDRAQFQDDPDSRAQSIIEYLRTSTIFQSHFRTNFEPLSIFEVRKKCIEMSKRLLEAETIFVSLERVGLLGQDITYCRLLQILLECEDPKLMFKKNEFVNQELSRLSQEYCRSITYEMKEILLADMEQAVQELVLAVREKQCEEDQKLSHTIEDAEQIYQDAIKQKLNSMKELKIHENMSAEMKRKIEDEINKLSVAMALNQLRPRLLKTRPKSLSLTKSYSVPSNFTDLTFLKKNFDSNLIPQILLSKNAIEKATLTELVELLKQCTQHNFVHPENHSTSLKFNGTHLYLSECLKDPKLLNYLDQFRENYTQSQISIEFHGVETLTLDVDLDQNIFHGIDVTFNSNKIFVEPQSKRTVTLDVSGNNAKQHKISKPRKPAATGCNGTDGLHGNVGESGGNIFLICTQSITGEAKLITKSNGGNGGRGQDGGDGSDGKNGLDGTHGKLPDEKPKSGKRLLREGTVGLPGERGGDSGRVGSGGLGGVGGYIITRMGDQVLQEKGNDGKPGDDGEPGIAGTGGKGGKPGIDAAWITYSAWPHDPWQRIVGKQGEEKINLDHHDGFWAEGYTVDRFSAKPSGICGINGIRRNEKSTMTRSQARAKYPAKNSLINVRDHNEADDNIESHSILHAQISGKCKQLTELESNLGKRRRLVYSLKEGELLQRRCLDNFKNEKKTNSKSITELDKFREDINTDFKEIRTKLHKSIHTHHQEMHKITNPFLGMDNTNEVNNLEVIELFKDGISDSFIGNMSPTIKFFQQVLTKANSYEIFLEGEKYLMHFLHEDDQVQLEAASFLNNVLKMGQEEISTITIFQPLQLLEQIPLAYHTLKSVKAENLPKIDNVQYNNAFSFISNLVINRQTLDPSVMTQCEELSKRQHFNAVQKSNIRAILVPFYCTQWIPRLKNAWNNKSKTTYSIFQPFSMAKSMASWTKDQIQGTNQDTEIVLDDCAFKIITVTLLKWQQDLPTNLSEINLLKMFEDFLGKYDSHKSLFKNQGELLQNFLNQEIGINMDEIISNLKSESKKFVSYFDLLIFMTKHYTYDITTLDKLFRVHCKLIKKQRGDFAIRLKAGIELAYKYKFQEPILSQIFKVGNNEEADRIKFELVQIVNSIEKFETRKFHLQNLLQEIKQNENFQWDAKLTGLKNTLINKSQLPRYFHNFTTGQKIIERISAVKNIQMILQNSEFSADELLTSCFGFKFEESFRTIHHTLNTSKYPTVLEDFNICVTSFWKRQFVNIIGKHIRSNHHHEKFADWKSNVFNDVQDLLASNKILNLDQVEFFMKLKLEQVHFAGLKHGSIKQLDELQLKADDGDELERIRHILEELQDYTYLKSSRAQIFAKLSKDLQVWLSRLLVHEDNCEISEIVHNLIAFVNEADYKKLIKQLSAQNPTELDDLLTELEMGLIRNWKNIGTLSQFDVENSNPFDAITQDQIDALSSRLTEMIQFVKKQIKNKRIMEFLQAVRSMTSNHFDATHIKLFTSHVSKLQGKVESVIASFEEKGNERITELVVASFRTKNNPVTYYFREWNLQFECRWDCILELDEKHFQSALEEFVVVNNIVEEAMEMCEDTLPQDSSSTISDEELLKNVQESCANADARVWPAIELTLEMLDYLDISKRKRYDFLLQVKIGESGESYKLEDYCKFLKKFLLATQSEEIPTEFSNPDRSNSMRKMLVRLQKSKFRTTEIKEFLFRVFMDTNRATTLNEQESQLFRNILSEEEVVYFDKLQSLLPPTKMITISSTFKTLPGWETELQHLCIQSCFAKLVGHFGSDDKSKLEKILNEWNLKFCAGENQHYYKTWVNTTFKMTQALELMPIPLRQLAEFLEICLTLPLSMLENIVGKHLPCNYLKYSILAKTEEYLEEIINSRGDDKTYSKEIIHKLDKLIYSEETQIWDKFLQKLIEELANKRPSMALLFDIFDEQNFSDNETKTFIISKWASFPINKWKIQFRAKVYTELISCAEPTLITKLLEIDQKFRSDTESLVSHFVKQNICQFDMHLIANEILEKNYVINSKLISDLNTKHDTISILKYLEEFTNSYRLKEVRGKALITAMKNLAINQSNPKLQFESLHQDLREARRSFHEKSQLKELARKERKIQDWTREDITEWVNIVKLRKKDTSILKSDIKSELLAVICRALRIHNNDDQFTMRDTQLCAVLLFVDAKLQNVGRFAEIATSEGKTLISAVLAVCLSLDGNNVYLVTSSSVLAEDGFQNMSGFYSLFNIGVGNISSKEARKGTTSSEQMLEKLYKNQVLYGDAASFEADHLNCSYLQKNYKGGSNADYLIVDEVDSMLLDKGSNVLYISHTIPELRWLRIIFIDIWRMVSNTSDSADTAISRKIKMKYTLSKKHLHFPHFLLKFVQDRIPIWINNARKAKEMKQNIPYILASGNDDDGKVTIIDSDTGVEQKQTQYSYGLHQFLQLKEGNKLSSESLKAVFVSNVGYFSRFKGRIFGITGTIGEENATKLLSDLYTVDFYKMPRFKAKLCKKESSQLFKSSERKLYECAIFASVAKRKATQPILFICETVKSCKQLYSMLKKCVKEENLFCIYETEKYDEFRRRMETIAITYGDVIISTNLAGRGTDVYISKDCDAKGLHVVLTFIPPNLRVEKQAFGRTARGGQNGSTEYIVLVEDLKDTEFEFKIENYKEVMRVKEDSRLRNIRKRELQQIQFEEELFTRFAKKLEQIKSELQQPAHFKTGFAYLFKFANKLSNEEIETKLHIIINRWAFWLDSIQPLLQLLHDNPDEKKQVITEKFDHFTQDLFKIMKTNETLCQSPSDFVKVSKVFDEIGEDTKSIDILTEGLQNEKEFNEILYYYRGISYLKLDCSKKLVMTRQQARHDLKQAEVRIEKRISNLEELLGFFDMMQKLCSSDESSVESRNIVPMFRNQIEAEIHLYEQHIDHFLRPSLGHCFDDNTFKMIPMVHQDEAESRDILEVILRHVSPSIIKPLRLSMKVRMCKNTLYIGDNPLDFKVLDLSLEEPKLSPLLQELINSSSRVLEIEQLKDVIVTRDEVIEMIKKSEFLCITEEYILIEIGFDDFRFVSEFKETNEHYKNIGKILGEKNMQAVPEEEILTEFQNFLSIEDSKRLYKNLIQGGYLIKRFHIKGNISANACNSLKLDNEKLTGLPPSLQPIHSILFSWVVIDGKICPNLDSKFLKINPQSNSRDNEVRDIVNILISSGILKRPKVNWSLSSHFQKEDKRQNEIKAEFQWKTTTLHFIKIYKDSVLISDLRKTFNKFHLNDPDEKITQDEINDKFQEYLDQISDLLINSVGKIKTLEYMKIDKQYKHLSECYTGSSSLPPELFDLMSEDFDRIPSLREKIPWWSSGAFYVSILGILQIAAGVTVGVLSGGILVNLSMMLISEGGSDLMFAIQSGWGGTFSWKSYGIHKAFSVACSLATGGLGGITGGSWATIIALEIAEEIFKKTVLTVGRYVVQGVGTSLLNMTIEKGLDMLRGSVITMAKTTFDIWKTSSQAFFRAQERLKNSLGQLYKSSYRKGQAENIVINAKNAFGTSSTTSLIYHQLQNSLQKVASFYACKVSEKLGAALGHGFIDKVLQLYNILKTLFSSLSNSLENTIQRFTLEYMNKLSKHFEDEAVVLEKKREHVSAHTEQLDPTRCEAFIQTYTSNLDSEIVEEGLKTFQYETLEPTMKQVGARWLHGKCNRWFKGQANYSAIGGNSPDSSKSSIWKALNNNYAIKTNDRNGYDENNKVRNNIWDTEPVKGTFNYFARWEENWEQIQDHCKFVGSELEEKAAFILNDESSSLLNHVEILGINIARTFKL